MIAPLAAVWLALPSAAAVPAPVPSTKAAAVSPLPLTAVGRGVEERRGVGLLVVDVKDSTPLHLNVGNRRGHALVLGALDFAEASGSLFDGVVVRRLGDGHVMAFPTFEHALRAAATIQEQADAWRKRVGAPPLELRAGVHAGRVLVDGSQGQIEVYGAPVERALELTSAGQGRDVALDPSLEAHPAVVQVAARSGVVRGRAALLLKPKPAKVSDVPGLQPPLTASRMTAAATLFAGLHDFAPNYERYGRRAAYATLKAFHAYARAIVETHGGRWVKSDGETVMASFESTRAAVVAAEQLQRRVQELRTASPLGRVVKLKAGVSYGRAILDERLEGPDYYGNTVNGAARFMRLASPGEVLVSERLFGHAAQELDSAPRDSVSVKGFASPITVARLKPQPAAPDPAAVERLRAEARSAWLRVRRLP